MSETPEVREKITVVAAGSVVLAGGKLGLRFFRVREDGTADETARMVFDRKVKRSMGGNPGTMYRVDAVNGGASIFASTAEWMGRYADRRQTMLWEAQSRTTEAEHAARLSAKEAEKFSELFASLDPARKTYRGAIGTNRQMLLAIMVEYITRG
jgi:hypothetical protein